MAQAATWAALACFAGYLTLLYPGLHTPKPAAEASREAISRIGAPAAASASGTGDAERDLQLAQLVDSLAPPLKQTLSDALAIYRNAAPVSGPAPRRTNAAPVHITEWTDIRCDHCADLQQTLLELQEQTPPGSFTVEARQFPLDAECNSMVERAEDPVRCLAARARICLTGHPRSDEFARSLFARQKELTASELYRIAAPYMARTALESCVGSPETKAQLEEDIAYAARFASDEDADRRAQRAQGRQLSAVPLRHDPDRRGRRSSRLRGAAATRRERPSALRVTWPESPAARRAISAHSK